MMAKKELKWSPLLGQWMLLSGAVFIDRGNSKNAMHSLDKAAKDMKEQSVSTAPVNHSGNSSDC